MRDLHKRVFIVTGESSGDLCALSLFQKLGGIENFCISGMGGERLAQHAGADFLRHDDISVVGGTEVLSKLCLILRKIRTLKKWIRLKPFDVAILVDFPDFNFRLLRALWEKSIPVIYYVSPQLWAWRRGRIRKIKKYVDVMLVIFPFEVEFYKRHEVSAYYVGHPLLNVVGPVMDCPQPTLVMHIGLFPGSRPKEVQRLLPILIESAQLIHHELKCEFTIFKAPHLNKEFFSQSLPHYIKIKVRNSLSDYEDLDFAIACSGTLTAELAFLKIPMVVLYKLSFMSYVIAKMLIRGVKNIAMSNLILQESYFPELIQHKAQPARISLETLKFLNDPTKYKEAKNKLEDFRSRMSEGQNFDVNVLSKFL